MTRDAIEAKTAELADLLREYARDHPLKPDDWGFAESPAEDLARDVATTLLNAADCDRHGGCLLCAS